MTFWLIGLGVMGAALVAVLICLVACGFVLKQAEYDYDHDDDAEGDKP